MTYVSTDKPTLSHIFSTFSSRLVLAVTFVSSPLFAADKGQNDPCAKSVRAGQKFVTTVTGGGTSRSPVPTTRTLRTEEDLDGGERAVLARGNEGLPGVSATSRALSTSGKRGIKTMGCESTFAEAYHLDEDQIRVFKQQWGISPEEVKGSFFEDPNGPLCFVPFDPVRKEGTKPRSKAALLNDLESLGKQSSYKMGDEARQLFNNLFVVIGNDGCISSAKVCLMIAGYFMHKEKLASGQKQETLSALARMYLNYFFEHAYSEG